MPRHKKSSDDSLKAHLPTASRLVQTVEFPMCNDAQSSEAPPQERNTCFPGAQEGIFQEHSPVARMPPRHHCQREGPPTFVGVDPHGNGRALRDCHCSPSKSGGNLWSDTDLLQICCNDAVAVSPRPLLTSHRDCTVNDVPPTGITSSVGLPVSNMIQNPPSIDQPLSVAPANGMSTSYHDNNPGGASSIISRDSHHSDIHQRSSTQHQQHGADATHLLTEAIIEAPDDWHEPTIDDGASLDEIFHAWASH